MGVGNNSQTTSITPHAARLEIMAELEGWIAGHLSVHTRRAYTGDAQTFERWLTTQQLSFVTLTQNDLVQYRRYLSDSFARPTAARKLVVARRLLEEALNRGLIHHNPAHGIKGIKTDQETPHHALNGEEAKTFLKAIDTTTRQGKRDFAIVLLMVRTGIRRSECCDLRLGDLEQEAGHHIAVIRHAKGDKRRKVKIPVDVMRAIEDYVVAIGHSLNSSPPHTPLFVQFRRGDHPGEEAISGQVIERVVETHAARCGLKLSPHGLRASFVTLALEGGARLQQVQYAVGHADPRTTERYQTRKLNLDNNAVDFVKIALD